MIFIGIDPGLTGAVAALDADGALIAVHDIPTMSSGKGRTVRNEINASELAWILRGVGGLTEQDACRAVLERVGAMPGQGVSSMFSMGDSFGAIRATLAVLGISTELVTPRKWKGDCGLNSDKEVCRAKAIQLYPGAPLARKKDHNRAESIMLARWLWERR